MNTAVSPRSQGGETAVRLQNTKMLPREQNLFNEVQNGSFKRSKCALNTIKCTLKLSGLWKSWLVFVVVVFIIIID